MRRLLGALSSTRLAVAACRGPLTPRPAAACPLLLMPQRRHAHHKKGKSTDGLGQFKSPIVEQLWSMRSTDKELDMDLGLPAVDRKPSDSRTIVAYPFTTQPFLTQSYENPWGFFRKGKLLEDMDAIAGSIAYRHCEREGKVPLLVTASVDKIRLTRNPPLDRQDMELSGSVVWTGSSSMMIQLEMRCLPDEDPWVNASFTFVARSPQTGKAVAINRLVPETSAEKKLFEDVERETQRRKALRRSAASPKKGGGGSGSSGGGGKGNNNIDKEAMTALLLQQARPLLEMPCLADPTCVLVDSTRLANTCTMQAQQRNMMNRIFGGFLLRKAYEIAFSTAYLFAGSRPEFQEVAHVDFLSPVDVGDLVRFDSAVLHSHTQSGCPVVHVQVVASICRPERTETNISNTFNFVFDIGGKATVRRVLPANLDQAKRMVERMSAESEE